MQGEKKIMSNSSRKCSKWENKYLISGATSTKGSKSRHLNKALRHSKMTFSVIVIKEIIDLMNWKLLMKSHSTICRFQPHSNLCLLVSLKVKKKTQLHPTIACLSWPINSKKVNKKLGTIRMLCNFWKIITVSLRASPVLPCREITKYQMYRFFLVNKTYLLTNRFNIKESQSKMEQLPKSRKWDISTP